MRSKNIPASTLETAPRRDEFSRAKAKVKTKYHAFPGEPKPNTDVARDVAEAGLGVILCAGAIIGLSGFFFLIGGLVKSGGITAFAKGWFIAFTGI